MMGFFSSLFRNGAKPSSSVITTKNIVAKTTNYSKLNREQLIERIVELEKAQQDDASKGKDEIGNKRKSDTPANNNGGTDSTKKRKKTSIKPFDFSKHNTRFIALRFAYLGWNYNGLALQYEATALPTVEATILEAMNKAKLVPSMIPQDYDFSRCGRTDKGVSAMDQVISLRVRSNLTNEEQMDPQNDDREIPYVHILNQLLPDDIRVSAVSLRPPKDFDARFSCNSRHYKYLFSKDNLNLEKMKQAAKLFEGEHDFRNFCKLDGSKQIKNFKRTIISSDIMPIDDNFYCFDLIGTAFLWHQVRCMMANLFLVGQELEDPTLITDMMNIEMTPQKPIYDMASDLPLILYECDFPPMEWIETDVHDFKSIRYGRAVYSLALKHQLKASISGIFKNVLPTASIHNVPLDGKTITNLGNGRGNVVTHYKKMKDRDVMQSVEVVNAKFAERKSKKKNGSN